MTKRFAVLNNAIVDNIAIADAPVDANWIDLTGVTPEPAHGWSYDNGVFTAPIVPPAVVIPDPAEFLIDVGPFFDRFGATKMAVLTSTDAGVKALLQDMQIRHWIDLTRTEVAQALSYIGSVIPAVDSVLQTAILTSPVLPNENLALRKSYF